MDEKSFLNVSLLESSYCTDEIHREKVPYRLAIALCLVGHEFEECENCSDQASVYCEECLHYYCQS